MTEGMGHVIDPAGVARSALQAAVADYGPDVLWNAARLDDFCRDRLAGLPGEAALISSAARSNVPGLLRQQLLPGFLSVVQHERNELHHRLFFSLFLLRGWCGLKISDLQFRHGRAAGIHLAALFHQGSSKEPAPLSFRIG